MGKVAEADFLPRNPEAGSSWLSFMGRPSFNGARRILVCNVLSAARSFRCWTHANGMSWQTFAKRRFAIWLRAAKRLFTSLSASNRWFRGRLQGLVGRFVPEGEIDFQPGGVPYVKRELNWLRVAQRFPARIEAENPDLDLFHMGASAVAIMKSAKVTAHERGVHRCTTDRSGWVAWLRRELTPSHEREVRAPIIIAGTVFCVVISMTLQVPELSDSAYMVFFVSKENNT